MVQRLIVSVAPRILRVVDVVIDLRRGAGLVTVNTEDDVRAFLGGLPAALFSTGHGCLRLVLDLPRS